MLFKLIAVCAVVQLVVSQDAPITFKDGKIGVNFGGYHAEAGLGGLLTGNAAHGGLTASAGTPFGQSAHAGLGGNTGPNARGGLFAGATAGNGVGAGASLAGDVNNGGSFGVGQAEAYVPGARKEVIKTVSSGAYLPPGSETNVDASSSSASSSSAAIDEDDNDLSDNKVPQAQAVDEKPQTETVQQQTVTQVVQPANVAHVQKIKVRPRPVQTYTVVQKQVEVPTYTSVIKQYPIPVYQPAVLHKRIQITAPYQVVQRVEEVPTTLPTTTSTTTTSPRPIYNYTYDKNKVINEILSIPFHAIRAVNEIINAKLAGGYSVQKTITYN